MLFSKNKYRSCFRIGFVAAAVGFVGCNGDGLGFGFPESTSNTSTSIHEVTISIASPANTFGVANAPFGINTVEVNLGTRVTWVNNDTKSHSIAALGGEWDLGSVAPGRTVSRVFSEFGAFNYGCRIHPEEQTGSIRVVSVPVAFPSASPSF